MSGFSFFSNPNAVSRSFSRFRFGPPAPPKCLLIAPYLDKEVLVLLIEDRKVYGCLRSFDAHGNLVLEGARERIIVGDLYCDVPLGLYVIRGESSVLIGELKLGKEELPQHMTCVSEEEIKKAQKVEKEAKDLKSTMMKRMGFLDLEEQV
ncbi:PREDICTED: sm-like protein LSM1A [Lupinus angustifolius]|uniref:sm-like protein LSM1A n=1 Tax=Lupinus angustifolius TaxID=3871 RepID=UPI00092E32F9|nr:PREDICTED: sm-like protein LSM1A [Lupinus angustifolius]